MPATCPLCGHVDNRVIRTFSLTEVAEFFTPKMVSVKNYERMKLVLSELWQSGDACVMRCGQCDLGFAVPFVAGTAEFYQLEAPDTPYPKDKWEYQRTLQSLQDRPKLGLRLLDVGAGKGYFLSHLLTRGWKPGQLASTEYSSAGREAIERLGVACAQSDLRSLNTLGVFDVICMFQVLEHLDGYDSLFEGIGRLARPQAEIFIAVPNGARIDFNEDMGLQYDFPPNHLSRWSRKSFEVLAAKYGWVVEGCEVEPQTNVWQEAVYGAVNRYIRNSHVLGSWARLTYGLADRAFVRSSRANKLVKAFGMATSPDVWLTAARVAFRGRSGGIPHALWVHLRHTD